MRQAIRWRLLAEDPTTGAQLPRQRRRELRVLTAEQSRLFLEAALRTPYAPVFAVALTTAARPSEYLALKWQDINWERGTVSVARTLERMSGGWCLAETKRSRSRRVIKLCRSGCWNYEPAIRNGNGERCQRWKNESL